MTYTSKGIEIEADPRHAKLVLEHVKSSRTIAAPCHCVKESAHAEDDTYAEQSLKPEDVTPYRSTAMRVAYLH